MIYKRKKVVNAAAFKPGIASPNLGSAPNIRANYGNARVKWKRR